MPRSWTGPTRAQLRLLWFLARRACLDYDALHVLIRRRYGKTSVKELSRGEFQGLIRTLRNRARRLALNFSGGTEQNAARMPNVG